MRSDAPRLLPVLRSRHQADLLTMLLLHPDTEYTIAELTQVCRLPQSTSAGSGAWRTGIPSPRPVAASEREQARGGSAATRGSSAPTARVVVADEFAGLEDVVLVATPRGSEIRGAARSAAHDVDVSWGCRIGLQCTRQQTVRSRGLAGRSTRPSARRTSGHTRPSRSLGKSSPGPTSWLLIARPPMEGPHDPVAARRS
jgi:hypothetical protein